MQLAPSAALETLPPQHAAALTLASPADLIKDATNTILEAALALAQRVKASVGTEPDAQCITQLRHLMRIIQQASRVLEAPDETAKSGRGPGRPPKPSQIPNLDPATGKLRPLPSTLQSNQRAMEHLAAQDHIELAAATEAPATPTRDAQPAACDQEPGNEKISNFAICRTTIDESAVHTLEINSTEFPRSAVDSATMHCPSPPIQHSAPHAQPNPKRRKKLRRLAHH